MCDVQDARAALRLGFLSLVRALAGRPAAIVTVEGNQVSGVVAGIDRDSERLAVSGLATPAGTVAHAVLRLGDIDHIVLHAGGEAQQ